MIIYYIILIGLPVLLVLFILKKIMTTRAVEKHGQQTNAVVTQIRLLQYSKGSSDSVTLEYTDHTGTRYPAKLSSVPGQYKVGNTIPLKYQQEKPSRYVIAGMQQGQWVLFIFSVLLLLFALFASYKVNEMVVTGNY